MFLRTAIVAAALAATAAPSFAEPAQNARCEATTFRVYFGHNSAALDQTTREMMDVAERNVAGCEYAELRISVANNAYAAQRANAIRAAANDRDWDAVRIEPRGGAQRASYGGPEYAEVTMTYERSTDTPAPLTNPNIGA